MESSSSLVTGPKGLEKNLNNIIDDKSLKYIFIGGKGGVGKTTIASSLALAIAQSRPSEKILLVSTDPAHSLSDAFDQKFETEPIKAVGSANLYVMESSISSVTPGEEESDMTGFGLSSIIKEFPGIDEAFGLVHLMKTVESNHFGCTIFDTAPTGHTLHFLALPDTMLKFFKKFQTIQSSFGNLLNMAGSLFGFQGANLTDMFDSIQTAVEKVSTHLKSPDKCQFICVTTAGKLPLYETERLTQKLSEYNIEAKNVVINRILPDSPDLQSELEKLKNPKLEMFASFFLARLKSQQKFLEAVDILYPSYSEDPELFPPFHVVKVPLLHSEVRGTTQLLKFSKFLKESPSSTKFMYE